MVHQRKIELYVRQISGCCQLESLGADQPRSSAPRLRRQWHPESSSLLPIGGGRFSLAVRLDV